VIEKERVERSFEVFGDSRVNRNVSVVYGGFALESQAGDDAAGETVDGDDLIVIAVYIDAFFERSRSDSGEVEGSFNCDGPFAFDDKREFLRIGKESGNTSACGKDLCYFDRFRAFVCENKRVRNGSGVRFLNVSEVEGLLRNGIVVANRFLSLILLLIGECESR